MNNNKKISIIIPSYNHARYIQQAVDSVLKQTWTDWELIIIDDASTDESQDVLFEMGYTLNDLRIQIFFHEKNRGAHHTINEGLQLASGDYLTILNSDDVYHPERLERFMSVAGQYDFISSKVDLLDSNDDLVIASDDEYTQSWLSWYQDLCAQYQTTQVFQTTLLYGNFLITTSNFFFHRRVLNVLQGFAHLRYVHDYEFVLRLFQRGFSAILLNESLLAYRLHASNTIREAPLKAIEENMEVLLQYLQTASLQAEDLKAMSMQLNRLYHYTHTEWSTEVHRKLVAKEAELFPLIDDRNRWIQERDMTIAEQKVVNEQQLQMIADRDAWIKERDQLVKQQQQWIIERDAWVLERDSLIQDQQQWLEDRNAWIRERDATIQNLQTELALVKSGRAYRWGQKLRISSPLLNQLLDSRKPVHPE